MIYKYTVGSVMEEQSVRGRRPDFANLLTEYLDLVATSKINLEKARCRILGMRL